jgi:hypothetical protein
MQSTYLSGQTEQLFETALIQPIFLKLKASAQPTRTRTSFSNANPLNQMAHQVKDNAIPVER